MKNLFVILAVLAMVAFASAASVSLVPSVTTASIGDTVTISLIADTDVIGVSMDAIKDNVGSDSQGAISVSLNSGFGAFNAPGIVTNGYDADLDGNLLVSFVAGNCGAGVKVLAGTTLWSMEYKIPTDAGSQIIIGAFEIYGAPQVDFFGGSLTNDIGAATINIPEPMTIALLGLGGLFLRRKLS